jgi:hypothetical protein
MRRNIIRAVVALAGLVGFFSVSIAPAGAASIYKSDCSGTYVVGIQVVGPPIYCPESS